VGKRSVLIANGLGWAIVDFGAFILGI